MKASIFADFGLFLFHMVLVMNLFDLLFFISLYYMWFFLVFVRGALGFSCVTLQMHKIL